MVKISEREMNERSKYPIRMNAEDIFEGIFIKNPERMNILEGVQIPSHNDPFASDDKFYFLRIFGEKEIAHHPNENKGNSHEWAIGKEGVGNDGKKKNGCYDDSFRIGSYVNVFGGDPRKEHAL
jgi:hypothetical protein